MKRVFQIAVIFSLLFSSIAVHAQLEEYLDKQEAVEMIRLCNSYTFIDLYGDDREVLPKNYKKEYSSGIFGMDNKYQIYTKGKSTLVVNLRGSTDKKESWLENFYSSMIPAKGTMSVEGEPFKYNFSDVEGAAVHAGYALGIGFLRKDLLFHLKFMMKAGYNNLVITGHSQGGALANLLATCLTKLPADEFTQPKSLKVYAFAAPMVGNKTFVMDYNRRFCADKKSFNLVNPKDPIPRLPMTYNDTNLVSSTITNLLTGGSVNKQKLLIDGAMNLFEGTVRNTTMFLGHMTSKEITKDVGDFHLPPYTPDVNYGVIGNVVHVVPPIYPRVLKDPSIMENDSLVSTYRKDSDGYFIDGELYKKEPMFFQHKPFNYYVSLLRMYFPKKFVELDKPYLPENL